MNADDKARSEADELFRKGYECLNGFEFDRAIEYFNQALELNHDDAIVLAGRGFAFKRKGDVDKASAAFSGFFGQVGGETDYLPHLTTLPLYFKPSRLRRA